MKTDEDESASRSSSGADKGKKKKNRTHNHIGPNVRAFRDGRAFCPVCDADKYVRLTEEERQADRLAKEAQRASK